MNGRFKTALMMPLLLCLFSPTASGNGLKEEIDHLIEFINKSDCIFIRNDNAHTAKEACQHILKKYHHFKDKISTAEEFIERCATKSSLSDRFYEVSCDGNPKIRCQDWLLEELVRFRNNQNKGSGVDDKRYSIQAR